MLAGFFLLAALFLPLFYRLAFFYQNDLISWVSFAFFFLSAFDSLLNHKPLIQIHFLGVSLFIFLLLLFLQYGLSKFGISGSFIPSSVYPFATRTGFVYCFSYWIFFHLFIQYANDRRIVQFLLTAIFLAAYVVSLMVLFQRFFGRESSALANPAFAWISHFPAVHPNPNNLASFLELIAPLTLGVGYYRLFHVIDKHPGGRNAWPYLVQDGILASSFFLLILIFAAAVGTLSKFSLISLGVGMFSFLILAAQNQRKKWIVFTLIGFIALGIFFSQWTVGKAIGNRFAEAKAAHLLTLDFRIPFWQRAWPLFLKFPLFGAGFGTFSEAFSSFHRVDVNYFSDHLLNDYFELAVETGVAGILICLVAWIGFLTIQIKKVFSERSYFRRFVGIGLISGLISFFTHEFLISNLHDPANSFYVMLFAGLSVVVSQEKETQEEMWWKKQGVLIGAKKTAGKLFAPVIFIFILAAFAFFLRAQFADVFIGKNPIEMSYKRARALDSENAAYSYWLSLLQKKRAGTVNDPVRRIQVEREAMFSVESAIELNPFQLIYRMDYSELALKSKKYEEGNKIFVSQIERMPFDLELLLGDAFYDFKWAAEMDDENERAKLIQNGIEIYKHARALDPHYVDQIKMRKSAILPQLVRSQIETLL